MKYPSRQRIALFLGVAFILPARMLAADLSATGVPPTSLATAGTNAAPAAVESLRRLAVRSLSLSLEKPAHHEVQQVAALVFATAANFDPDAAARAQALSRAVRSLERLTTTAAVDASAPDTNKSSPIWLTLLAASMIQSHLDGPLRQRLEALPGFRSSKPEQPNSLTNLSDWVASVPAKDFSLSLPDISGLPSPTAARSILPRVAQLRQRAVRLLFDQQQASPNAPTLRATFLSGFTELEPLLLADGTAFNPDTRATVPVADLRVAARTLLGSEGAAREGTWTGFGPMTNNLTGMQAEQLLPQAFSALFSLALAPLAVEMPRMAERNPPALVTHFQDEGFIAHRSEHALTLVMVYPVGETWVFPLTNGTPVGWLLDRLTARVQLPTVNQGNGAAVVPRVEENRPQVAPNAFALASLLDHQDGAVTEQRVFAGLPSGELACFQRFTARRALSVLELEAPSGSLRGMTDAAMNPGSIFWEAGQSALAALPPLAQVPGRWWNLADQLGAVSLGTTGWTMGSDPLSSSAAQKVAVRHLLQKAYRRDEIIAQHTFVLASGQSNQQMASLSRRLEKEGDLQTSRVHLGLGEFLLTVDFDQALPFYEIKLMKRN